MSSDNEERSFSDEELEHALEDFEHEFEDAQHNANPTNLHGSTSEQDDSQNSSESSMFDSLEQDSFDEELAGILGDKAKAAIIISPVVSPEFCANIFAMIHIPAVCVAAKGNVVSVLKDLDDDHPEQQASRLAEFFKGVEIALLVNRANKIDSTLYNSSQNEDSVPPPVVFAATPPFVEDVMLGITSWQDIMNDPAVKCFDSSDISEVKAQEFVSKVLSGEKILPPEEQ
ncbi:MAG: hypothetical protein Q3961_00020 [Bifidobacteriaceae bacterium]|nr:hypothetical protein [Bifidobacteriaceae bacterium]